MTKYYVGPTNSGVLIGIACTLCVVTGLLVLWRLAFRFSRRTLGVSDVLLTLGLVRIIHFLKDMFASGCNHFGQDLFVSLANNS